jgi:hypothetical protein
MRLTTRGATTFELAPDSYSKMMVEVRQLVTELLTDQISVDMVATVTRKVLDTVNYDHIAQHAGMNLDYSRVVDYARGGIISHLLNDERFSSRLMRLVGDATVGVTNETVERVTAIIESKSNNNSDL